MSFINLFPFITRKSMFNIIHVIVYYKGVHYGFAERNSVFIQHSKFVDQYWILDLDDNIIP